jgi:hypothetical protein
MTKVQVQGESSKSVKCGACRGECLRARNDAGELVLVDEVAFGRGPDRVALTPDLFGGAPAIVSSRSGSQYRRHNCPRLALGGAAQVALANLKKWGRQ